MSETTFASPSTLVLAVDPPIEHAGGKITELKLREPTGAEMREAEKALDKGFSPEAESNYASKLISGVSGVPEAALRDVPVSLIGSARKFLDGFDRWPENPAPAAPSFDVRLPTDLVDNGITYAQISLSEPTFGDHRSAQSALSQGQTAAATRQYQLILIAKSSGIPFATVEKMPVSALNAGQVFLMSFIAPGPTTGSASSGS